MLAREPEEAGLAHFGGIFAVLRPICISRRFVVSSLKERHMSMHYLLDQDGIPVSIRKSLRSLCLTLSYSISSIDLDGKAGKTVMKKGK